MTLDGKPVVYPDEALFVPASTGVGVPLHGGQMASFATLNDANRIKELAMDAVPGIVLTDGSTPGDPLYARTPGGEMYVYMTSFGPRVYTLVAEPLGLVQLVAEIVAAWTPGKTFLGLNQDKSQLEWG
jgi:hypothetical protein